MPEPTYHRSIHDLYEKEFFSDDPNFTYSLRNPVGFYQTTFTLYRFLEILNRNNIRLRDMTSILDLGCGIGVWLRFISEVRGGAKGLTGIDLSETRIRQAQAMNSSIKWIKGDICHLPFDANSFDFVFTFVSFMFLTEKKDLEQSVHEAARVTKQGGYFLFYDVLGGKGYSEYTRGFQEQEVVAYFQKEKFHLVDKQYNFKNLFGMKRFATSYLSKKLPIGIVWLLEHFPLAQPTHVFLLFRKQT